MEKAEAMTGMIDPYELYKRETESLGLTDKTLVAYVQDRAREDRQAAREDSTSVFVRNVQRRADQSKPITCATELDRVFEKHKATMTDLPGETDLGEHSVRLTEHKVVNVRPYPLPFTTEKVVEEEVNKMLELGVIEPSVSPFCSPIVLVKKKDNSTRFCIDFRALNRYHRIRR